MIAALLLALQLFALEPRVAILPGVPNVTRPGLEINNRRARRRDRKMARAK